MSEVERVEHRASRYALAVTDCSYSASVNFRGGLLLSFGMIVMWTLWSVSGRKGHSLVTIESDKQNGASRD